MQAVVCRRSSPTPDSLVPEPVRLLRRQLPRLAERDVRPALERELEIHAAWRKINQRAAVIDREIVIRLGAKLLKLLFVLAADPTRGVHVHGVKHTLHAVLVLEPERDHLELQLADRAQYQVVVAQGLEQLGRALLAQL